VAEPNVAIIRFAYDVAIAIVSGSVFVRVPSSVVMVAATVMTAAMMTAAMMTAAMMTAAMMAPSMAATFRIG